jgi:hypothetical protein
VSSRLDVRAEVVKLAGLLETAPEELAYLEAVPHGDLRTFRERATDRLFGADGDRLRRVATASGLVPPKLAATIGQRVFGPLLSARVAGLLAPDRAVAMARHLEVPFLADVSVALDPRHASEVIRRMPASVVVAVAKELVRRREYITMGRFVAYVDDDAMQAATGVIDDAGLLEIGFVLEDKDRLDHVVSVLPRDRLGGVIAAAAQHDLWPEALSLLQHISGERSGDLADLAAGQEDAVVTSLIQAVHDEDLWDTLLPVTGLMSDDARRRFASVPIVCSSSGRSMTCASAICVRTASVG